MERSVSLLWAPLLLEEASAFFGANAKNCALISDVENFVYECRNSDGPLILRVSHESHRQRSAIAAELHWMNYLVRNQVSVPRPIASTRGELIETVERCSTSTGSTF